MEMILEMLVDFDKLKILLPYSEDHRLELGFDYYTSNPERHFSNIHREGNLADRYDNEQTGLSVVITKLDTLNVHGIESKRYYACCEVHCTIDGTLVTKDGVDSLNISGTIKHLIGSSSRGIDY